MPAGHGLSTSRQPGRGGLSPVSSTGQSSHIVTTYCGCRSTIRRVFAGSLSWGLCSGVQRLLSGRTGGRRSWDKAKPTSTDGLGWATAGGDGAWSKLFMRARSCGRNFSQRNSVKNRMASALKRLFDSRSRRSSSRLQTSSVVGMATSDPGEGWLGDGASLGVFVSGDPLPEAWTSLGAGAVWDPTSLSSSARADCACGPSG